MINVLFHEDKNSKKIKFLKEITNIDKVLNLSNINDLNLATNEFTETSIEFTNAKDLL
jgi:hypothetical protein